MQSMFKFAPGEFIASMLNKTKSDLPVGFTLQINNTQ